MGSWIKAHFRKLKLSIYSLLSVLGLVLMLVSVSGQAAGPLCGSMGTYGLTGKHISPVISDMIADRTKDIGSRKYTISELFGSSNGYGIPFGEHKGSWWHSENKKISDVVGELDGKQKERLNAQGEKICLFMGIQPTFQSLSEDITGMMSGVIKISLNAFFDSHLICDENNKGGCIDLLGIAGGKEGGSGGLIGSLSRGVFFPLLTIAFLFTAGYMAYQGFVKKQFRESLNGFLWALFAMLLGVMVSVKPWVFARAPHQATSVISTCILNVLTGGSCLSTNSNSQEFQSDQACTSFSKNSLSPNESTQLTLRSLSCNITKGFTIDRWAQQQFGYNFNELYTVDPPEGLQAYPKEKLQGNPEDYCVNMYSADSPLELFKKSTITTTESSDNKWNINSEGELQANSNKKNAKDTPKKFRVCNIAATYMASKTVGSFGNKAQMEHVVATAAKDERMWAAFTGSGRDWIGFSSIIGMLAIMFTFIPVVMSGLAYSLVATFLMIFAPIFLLLAIHPGRGRKIFLGWLESLVSTILKYLAVGLLLIIMLTMYTAVFQSVKGGMVMITSIILAFTFGTYRKEIVNLIGATNMGGIKMANKAKEALDKKTQKAKAIGSAVAGGAIGGAMAGDIKAGIKQGVGMELRRGRNFMANAARAGRQVKNIKEKEIKEKQAQDREDAYQEKVLDNMNEQTNKIVGVADTQTAEIIKDRTLNTIDSEKADIGSQAIKDSLNKYKEKVESVDNSKDAQNVNMESKIVINEAKKLDNYIKSNSMKANNAINEYTKDFRTEEMKKINEKAQILERHFGENVAKAYTDKEFNRLDDTIKNIRNEFEVTKSTLGKSRDAKNKYSTVTKIDIENIIKEKQQFSENGIDKTDYKKLFDEAYAKDNIDKNPPDIDIN